MKTLACSILQQSLTVKQHKLIVGLRMPALKLISHPALDTLIILLVTASSYIYIVHKMHEEIR